MLHKALLFQENREGVRMLGEGVPTNPISRMLRIGLWCTAGLAEKGQGVQERVEFRRIMPIKASAQEPQATGGRVLAEQALAGKGRGRAAGRSPGARF